MFERSRPRIARLIACLLALLAGMTTTARAQPLLAAGDLVVVDVNNARVLRVRPWTGGVATFFPPVGGQLLEAPTAIVATDQGHIYVVDAALEAIVEIHAETGDQSLLLTPDGSPVRAHDGLAVDARSVLYGWDRQDGVVRVAPAPGDRWNRTILSDFDRPSDFRMGGLAATRDEDGFASEIFVAASVVVGDDPSAVWRIDVATGTATTIPATEDSEARYNDVIARGDCKALSCTVIHARCEDNAGILDDMGTLELFGIVGVIPVFGTLYDGFDATRCAYGLAPGATADEQFVGTMRADYGEGRVERVAGSPPASSVTAYLPRGPFDAAPWPIAMARVIRPDPIEVPEAGADLTTLAALVSLSTLAQLGQGIHEHGRRRRRLRRDFTRSPELAGASRPNRVDERLVSERTSRRVERASRSPSRP